MITGLEFMEVFLNFEALFSHFPPVGECRIEGGSLRKNCPPGGEIYVL